jgi:hypothetical protein
LALNHEAPRVAKLYLRKRYGLDEEQIAWMQWAVRDECAKDFDKFCEDYPFDPESAFRTSGRCRFNATNLKKMVEQSHMFPPDFGNIDMLDNRAVWRPCTSDEARVVGAKRCLAGMTTACCRWRLDS